MNEFQKYSASLFDFGENNIFKPKEKTNEEILKEKMQRSTKNEYKLTEKNLKFTHKGADISPERIGQIMKKYPPFQADAVPQDEIETFQKKGEQGWTYLTQQIFANNTAIEQKLEKMKIKQELEQKRREFKDRQNRLNQFQKAHGGKENVNSSAKDLDASLERPCSGEQSAKSPEPAKTRIPLAKHKQTQRRDFMSGGQKSIPGKVAQQPSKSEFASSKLSLKSTSKKRPSAERNRSPNH